MDLHDGAQGIGGKIGESLNGFGMDREGRLGFTSLEGAGNLIGRNGRSGGRTEGVDVPATASSPVSPSGRMVLGRNVLFLSSRLESELTSNRLAASFGSCDHRLLSHPVTEQWGAGSDSFP